MNNKKAVSIMIGYVLLVSIAMIIGASTYVWMKSYVPADKIQCVDGVSIYIKQINCTKVGDKIYLDLTLKNSGRFNIAGYYSYIAVVEGKEPSIDLSDFLRSDSFGKTSSSTRAIYFTLGNTISAENNFAPNEDVTHRFLVSGKSDIKEVSILPGRVEEVEGKKKYAVCSDAKISEEVFCE